MKIDGKQVRKWLFARMSHLSVAGKKHPVLAQVEGFTLDHAWKRLLTECFPGIRRSEWQMIEELDAEHDVGALGTHHPLNPIVVPAPRRIQ